MPFNIKLRVKRKKYLAEEKADYFVNLQNYTHIDFKKCELILKCKITE